MAMIITSPNQSVNFKQVAPFPEPAPVTRPMMAMMIGKMHQGSLPMNATPTKMNKNTSTAMGSVVRVDRLKSIIKAYMDPATTNWNYIRMMLKLKKAK
jgi:hypothetical protein